MKGNRKGAAFERDIATRLSLWWSKNKRTDIFWRSSQSGGRATQRAKSGKSTYGSYGDIAFVDPVGKPLLDVFTIELKRGRSHGNIADWIDLPSTGRLHCPFRDTLTQAIGSHEQAGSKTWMLLSRRDRRLELTFIESSWAKELGIYPHCIGVFRYGVRRIAFLRFSRFLQYVSPEDVIELSRR